jgi:hypothetical protein
LAVDAGFGQVPPMPGSLKLMNLLKALAPFFIFGSITRFGYRKTYGCPLYEVMLDLNRGVRRKNLHLDDDFANGNSHEPA